MIISFYILQILHNHYLSDFHLATYNLEQGSDAEKLKVLGLLVLGSFGTLWQCRNAEMEKLCIIYSEQL
jgi:hypothetical protein